MSGYAAMAKLNPNMSYELAPRAKIFRRDAGAVETLEDLKRFMRWGRGALHALCVSFGVTLCRRENHYNEGDPLATAPDHAIAAR